MRRTKAQKQQIIADYLEKLKKAESVILTSFSGLKTKSLFELKDRLFEKEIEYKVVKNRLLSLALKDQKIEIPSEILDKPLALAFSYQDEIEPAKIIHDFAKENENLEILGGIQNREFIAPEKIKALALLPSREELYLRLIGSLNMPKLKLLNILSQNQRSLVNILKHHLTQI